MRGEASPCGLVSLGVFAQGAKLPRRCSANATVGAEDLQRRDRLQAAPLDLDRGGPHRPRDRPPTGLELPAFEELQFVSDNPLPVQDSRTAVGAAIVVTLSWYVEAALRASARAVDTDDLFADVSQKVRVGFQVRPIRLPERTGFIRYIRYIGSD